MESDSRISGCIIMQEPKQGNRFEGLDRTALSSNDGVGDVSLVPALLNLKSDRRLPNRSTQADGPPSATSPQPHATLEPEH